MKNGSYTLVKAPDGYPGKRYRGRYVYEHHLVWWKHTGQAIPEGYIVHHKNEDKLDNRIENLELKTKVDHDRHHRDESRVTLTELQCSYCDATFTMAPRNYRFKVKNGQKTFHCSRKCQLANRDAWAQGRGRGIARESREHGVRATYIAGCRCPACRVAQRDYMRSYKKNIPTSSKGKTKDC